MQQEHRRQLDQIEQDIEVLKQRYDLYFSGAERLEPVDERKRLATALRNSRLSQARNTLVQFRLQTLGQRFATYENQWDRMLQRIEDGTLKRPSARMALADHPVLQMRFRRTVGHDVADVGAKAEESAATRPPAPAEPATAPPPPQPAALPDLQQLYTEYMEAKRLNGESARVSYDSFAASILKTRAAHLARFGSDDLAYRVRTRDGRVAVVAQPATRRRSSDPASA